MACAVSFAVLVTACGIDTAPSATEVSIDYPDPVASSALPVTEAGDDEIVSTVDITGQVLSQQAQSAQGGGGHQYGSTLDEWSDSVRELEQEPIDSASPSLTGFAEIEWEDLIPAGKSGPEIYARYEERLSNLEYGTDEAAELYAAMQAEFDPEAVNEELNGQEIRLAGFVAPLTYDGDQLTEFLLVPSFGACIHVPPPPPNQTVLVTLGRDSGLTPEETWGAVWVEGTMVLQSSTTDLAAANYTILRAKSGVYNNF